MTSSNLNRRNRGCLAQCGEMRAGYLSVMATSDRFTQESCVQGQLGGPLEMGLGQLLLD